MLFFLADATKDFLYEFRCYLLSGVVVMGLNISQDNSILPMLFFLIDATKDFP